MFTVILDDGKPVGTFHTYETAKEVSDHLVGMLLSTPNMTCEQTHSDHYVAVVTMRPMMGEGPTSVSDYLDVSVTIEYNLGDDEDHPNETGWTGL